MIDITSLYSKDDEATGEYIYYTDKALSSPFNGWVFEKYPDGSLMMEAEVKNGRFNGIQKHYYRNGQLEQANEMKDNTICGISKEYFENGRLRAECIVIRNLDLKKIIYDENGNIVKSFSRSPEDPHYLLIKKEIPEYIHLEIGEKESS